MTPAARCGSAAEILDRIAAGAPAERALTTWARGARYAGSKDRAAIRDLVFDALRRWRSSAARGGAETGRGRVLGLLREVGTDPDTLFTGDGHAPAPLSPEERSAGRVPTPDEAMDLPDWLCRRFEAAFGPRAAGLAATLRDRAPVTLRVNTLRGDLASAEAALAADGIATRRNSRAGTALTVIGNARRVAQSAAYRDGLVELQDAGSQAMIEALPIAPGARVLDYCAGGGGKTLALAARLGGGPVVAHDALPRRMADLPARAARAGARVQIAAAPADPFDLVLADVPCSGSGAWRRAPEGKWRLAPADLDALRATQSDILARAAALVAPGGALAYVTCSILPEENACQIAAFRARFPDWHCRREVALQPDDDGDGFYLAHLTREL